MAPHLVYGQEVGQNTVKIHKKIIDSIKVLDGYLCVIQKRLKIIQFSFQKLIPDKCLH